jgi:hypothetical protein
MIKYIAYEKDTPDVPRAWGEGETDLIARYQCEIALRTHLYIIKPEPNIKPEI